MRNMIQYLLMIIALCVVGNLNAQEILKPKRIIVSLNDTVRFVKEYNQNDSLIFLKRIQFWDDKSEHLFIDGFVFDNNREVYEYHATEDFLRLIHFVYDTITGLKEQFVKHTDSKPLNNEMLHAIKNREELIDLVESVIPKTSELKSVLDVNEHQTLVKKRRVEIYTIYQDTEIVSRRTQKFDKRQNLIFVEVRNEWQITTTTYKYNKKNQLIKKKFGFDDFLITTSFFYDQNLLMNSISKVKGGNVSSSNYFYENGILIKEIYNSPEGTQIFTFEYEFY